jgi:hypothetical protein
LDYLNVLASEMQGFAIFVSLRNSAANAVPIVLLHLVAHQQTLISFGYLLKVEQFKVKPFAERSRSGHLASTPLSERSLLMRYH